MGERRFTRGNMGERGLGIHSREHEREGIHSREAIHRS